MDLVAAIERLYRRVLLLVGIGRVRTVLDGGNAQLIQIQLGANDLRDNTIRLAEYGFASNPPAGSDAVVVFAGGNRQTGVIIATGNQELRMRNLLPGEAAIYDSLGQSVYLTQSGIVVNGAGLPVVVHNTPSVTLDTPLVHMTGNLQVDGMATVTGNIVSDANITAAGNVGDQGGSKTMAGMRTVFNAHDHVVANVQTGLGSITTSTPTPTE